MSPRGSRRSSFVGVGVVLVEEVFHCGWGFEVSYMLRIPPSVLVYFLLPLIKIPPEPYV